MKSERWTTESEIARAFPKLSDKSVGAGFTIFRSSDGEIYIDPSEDHAVSIGKTGTGKTQTVVLGFQHNIFKKGESLIMIDPKGEGYKYGGPLLPDDYQSFVLDLRSPR